MLLYIDLILTRCYKIAVFLRRICRSSVVTAISEVTVVLKSFVLDIMFGSRLQARLPSLDALGIWKHHRTGWLLRFFSGWMVLVGDDHSISPILCRMDLLNLGLHRWTETTVDGCKKNVVRKRTRPHGRCPKTWEFRISLWLLLQLLGNQQVLGIPKSPHLH